jgi:hypothetical protein
MNFPTLNTDSFYKFITILGLVIITFSSKMVADRFTETRNNELKYYSDSLTLSCEISNLELDKKLLINEEKSFGFQDSKNIDKTDSFNSTKIQIDKISNTIALKKGMIIKYKIEKEHSDYYLVIIMKVFTITCMLGFYLLIWGFSEWYNKQQKLKDKEFLRDYITLGQISEHCHSCGLIMTKDAVRPKEKDGSYNYIYCSNCYDRGEFIEPDISLDEMKNKIGRKYKNKLMLWWRLMQIERLQRWK